MRCRHEERCSIRTPQTLAWDLRYARQFKLPEGDAASS